MQNEIYKCFNKKYFYLNSLKYYGISVNKLDSINFNICLMTKEKVLPDNIINIEQVYRD